MSKAFTHYWTNATWQETAREAGEPLDHTAANVFLERGVEVGDRVYVVTIQKGVLHLLGSMVVGAVADYEQASDVLDYEPWDATDHLLASACTAMRFDRAVGVEEAARLRFEGTKGPTPLKFKASGVLDEQTLRGVRRLTPESADLFDSLLAGEPTFTRTWPDLDDADEDEDDEDEDVLQPMKEWFDEQEYAYDLDEDGDIIATFEDDEAEYDVLVTRVEAYIVNVIQLPLEVEEDRRAAVAEALMRANAGTFWTTFILSYDSGEVRLRSFVDPLEPEGAGGAFEGTLRRAIVFNGFLQQVIDGDRTPKEAVEEAEAQLQEETEESDEDDEDDAFDPDHDETAELERQAVHAAGQSASFETFIFRMQEALELENEDETLEVLKAWGGKHLLRYRPWLPDGQRGEPRAVVTLDDLYQYAKTKFEEEQPNASAEARLRADVPPGTPRREIADRLLRHAGDQGRRFLFRDDIKQKILPHLSDPITAAQSEALVRAAQQAHDLDEALRDLQSGGPLT